MLNQVDESNNADFMKTQLAMAQPTSVDKINKSELDILTTLFDRLKLDKSSNESVDQQVFKSTKTEFSESEDKENVQPVE